MSIEDPELMYLEFLPRYNSLTVKFETIRQMSKDFTDQDNKPFNLGELTRAYLYNRTNSIDFNFSSPDDFLERFKLESLFIPKI